MDELRLKLAVQKSGRLTDPSLDILTRCGLKLSRGKDQLMGFGENMPLDVLFVRDDDIPDLVQEDGALIGRHRRLLQVDHELLVEDVGQRRADRGAVSPRRLRIRIIAALELPFGESGSRRAQRRPLWRRTARDAKGPAPG